MKILPTTTREKKLWEKGHKIVGGIDEAGRGAWAGPVVAAVVVIDPKHRKIKDVCDSKMLSQEKREYLYEIITDRVSDFGIGIVDHDIIEEIGILEATKMAAMDAVMMLKEKPSFLLTDYLDLSKLTDIPHDALVGGDKEVYSISCASIIAKVTRDNIMSSLGGNYANYEFYKHKGYGTKRHQELLKIFGPSDIHRRTYKPIKAMYE